MSRITLNTKIDRLFEALKDKLITVFLKVDYIALTADIWSCKHRSFMGITAHFIEPTTFKRQSAVISCERFLNPHTDKRIAEHLQLVCDTYGITEKVIATTTDNATNFLKAFREFGISFDWHCSGDKETNQLYEEIEYIQIKTALSSQVKCGSHTFSRVGVKDAAKALTNAKYLKQHSSAFTKLNRIWKSVKSSTVCEKMVNVLGSCIQRPVATRWNSVFDCINKILKIYSVKLSELLTELEIPELTSTDYHFLHEYVKVFKPIAIAIDQLQGECNFALLLPIVHNTRQDLLQIETEKLKFCQPLLKEVLEGTEKRFGHLFDFDNELCKPALIATCTHPYFKTRWLTRSMRTSDNLDKIRKILVSAAHSIETKFTPIEVCAASPKGNLKLNL